MEISLSSSLLVALLACQCLVQIEDGQADGGERRVFRDVR